MKKSRFLMFLRSKALAPLYYAICSGLILLGLPLPAPVAQAQTVVQDGQATHANPSGVLPGSFVDVDSTVTVQRGDGAGHPYIQDASRDRDQVWSYTNALQSGQLWSGTRDSTLVLNVQGAQRIWLTFAVDGTAPADTEWVGCLLAVSVRSHTISSADTLTTFNWNRWGNAAVVSTAGDTANAASTIFTTATTLPKYVYTSDSKLSAQEFGVWVPNFSGSSLPRGIRVDLFDRSGIPFQARYMSVRVRPIGYYSLVGAALTQANHHVKVQMNVVGLR